ncbi:MAG: YceI family protein [Gammaproteobacteria bacterium]|nr:YceI family protein [Gammaproteobacteria bacterium]NNJ49567.1 YceI family protein [Gammaproteobacteria bacterium]
MTIFTKTIKTALLGVILGVFMSAPVFAEDESLCAPFEDSQVDKDLLASMLKAAEDGHLYRIKPDSSKMGFCINSPLGKVEAEFLNFKGGLALQDTQQQGTALVSIEVDSLETDSALIEAMLKGESFFNAEEFPEIIFVSTGVEWINDKKAVLKGDLTMHGITKAVAFYLDMKKAKTVQGEEILTVKATTSIQRSEFGMYTLSPMVDDRVSLCMSIDAYKYQS